MSKDIHSIIDKVVEEKQESLAAVERKRQLQQSRAIGSKHLRELETLASKFLAKHGYPLLHTEGNEFCVFSSPVAYSNEVWAAEAISQGAETVEEITEFVSEIREEEWDQEYIIRPSKFKGSLENALMYNIGIDDLHPKLKTHDPTRPCFCAFFKPDKPGKDRVRLYYSKYNTTHEKYYQQKFKEMLDGISK